MLMALVPPRDNEPGHRSCNGSDSAAPPVLPPEAAPAGNFTPARAASDGPAGAPSLPAERSTGTRDASGFRKGPRASVREPFSHLPRYFVGSVQGARTTPEVLPAVTSGLKDTPWEGAFKGVSTAHPLLAGGTALGSPANLSAATGNSGDFSLEGLRWTFILSLGFMVFWELLAAPLEQVADDSLFEYLDFVDATDRYRNLWIWRLLGTSAGVCGIAALVERLDCFLVTSGPPGVVHFYGYSLVSGLALLVSIAFPVPICRQREPGYRAVKALSLVEGAPPPHSPSLHRLPARSRQQRSAELPVLAHEGPWEQRAGYGFLSCPGLAGGNSASSVQNHVAQETVQSGNSGAGAGLPLRAAAVLLFPLELVVRPPGADPECHQQWGSVVGSGGFHRGPGHPQNGETSECSVSRSLLWRWRQPGELCGGLRGEALQPGCALPGQLRGAVALADSVPVHLAKTAPGAANQLLEAADRGGK